MPLGPDSNAPNYTAPDPNAMTCTRASQNWDQFLREIVTALISVAIVALALFLLWDVYCTAKGKAETFDRQKDLLSLVLGLLGTVTGYYFGRVPAERHADAARDAAHAAHERELKVRQQVHVGVAHIQKQHNATRAGPEPDTVNDAIDQLRSSL
jgi:hypothetical protein